MEDSLIRIIIMPEYVLQLDEYILEIQHNSNFLLLLQVWLHLLIQSLATRASTFRPAGWVCVATMHVL